MYDVEAKGFYTGNLVAQKGIVKVIIQTIPPFGTLDLDFSSPLAVYLIRFQRRAFNELTSFLGINTAGFDQGDSPTDGYACVSDNQLEWIQQGQMNVVRLPVLPNRVLKALPTSSTVYSPALFATAWTNGDNSINVCNSSNPYYPLGTYMSSVVSALKQGLYVIIDLHDNANHLDTFGTTMTPDNFVAFWRLIAQYINDNVDVVYQGNVFYELFNEPVGNKVGGLVHRLRGARHQGHPARVERTALHFRHHLGKLFGRPQLDRGWFPGFFFQISKLFFYFFFFNFSSYQRHRFREIGFFSVE